MYQKIALAILLAALLGASGCTALFTPGMESRQGASSSLVDYLYPQGEVPPDYDGAVPYLSLPLRVGIAFVPSQRARHDISASTKFELLEKVKASFVEHEYVHHIEIIPDTYLRSSSGVAGMQQVARMYGVDVMALVSYDQVSVSEDNNAAFLYWTIVGAYMIPGTNNEVQTFVDTAVFDVGTGKLLFRAPGVDNGKRISTAVGSSDATREQSAESFSRAVDVMTDNLAFELVRFEERVAEEPMLAEVQWKEGYGGMGSFDGFLLVLLVLIAIYGIGYSAEGTGHKN